MSDTEFAGIRRFHRITISAGIAFCVLMALRFFLSYSRAADPKYLAYGALAVIAATGLLLYLIRFWRTGLK